MDPQHWMHRDRATKPLTLSAQLAAMTAERDGLLKRVEAGEKLAEALLRIAYLWDTDAVEALAAWRAGDGG